jgi:hypothetical protein
MNKVVHCKKAPKGSFHYIGRPSPLGNPFPLDDPTDDDARRNVIEQYAEWFAGRVDDPAFRAEVEKVRGKDLGCWCAPRPCHGDVILSWLEQNPPRGTDRAEG